MQLFSSYFLGKFVVADNNGSCTFPMTFCLLDEMLTPWLCGPIRTLAFVATDVCQFFSIICLLPQSIHFQLSKIILYIYWRQPFKKGRCITSAVDGLAGLRQGEKPPADITIYLVLTEAEVWACGIHVFTDSELPHLAQNFQLLPRSTQAYH
jgi:hypothetical protein